jgi:hypothetical protein
MFTTTPFLSPREGELPMPMTSKPPSGFNSATIATIFDVPMSSPTIRFLLSFLPLSAMSCPSVPLNSFFSATTGRCCARQTRSNNEGQRRLTVSANERQSAHTRKRNLRVCTQDFHGRVQASCRHRASVPRHVVPTA